MAAANGFSTTSNDGTRRFGRHVWRRTGARWLQRLVPRQFIAALGNWTSAALDSYLEDADEFDTVGVPAMVGQQVAAAGSRASQDAGFAGLVVSGPSSSSSGSAAVAEPAAVGQAIVGALSHAGDVGVRRPGVELAWRLPADDHESAAGADCSSSMTEPTQALESK